MVMSPSSSDSTITATLDASSVRPMCEGVSSSSSLTNARRDGPRDRPLLTEGGGELPWDETALEDEAFKDDTFLAVEIFAVDDFAVSLAEVTHGAVVAGFFGAFFAGAFFEGAMVD